MLGLTRKTIAEEELLAEVLGESPGDPRAAFEELYERHAGPLLAFLKARGPAGQAEDLSQETWRRAWQYLRSPQAHGKPFHCRGWLFQVGKNLIEDRRRSELQSKKYEASVRRDKRQDREEAGVDRERLEKCLSKLPPDHAQAILIRLGGGDYEDVIAQLRVSQEKAYRLFFEAKKQLQDCVQSAPS